jgi:flagellar biosynthetic protein FliP
MNPNDTGSPETASLAATGEAVETETMAPRGTGGRLRGNLGAGWRFTRHLLEMVAAMMLGMGVLGLVLWALGEPPGYANLLVQYGLMGAFMAAPMVGWMRYRGHSWSDGGEMTAAMLVPMLAPVALVQLGVAVPGLSEGSLMVISHVVMIAGMVALMLYRFDRYAHGSHGRHAREGLRASSG